MDTRWLEDFVALRETGNFTRAAEKRYVTQPAFSRRIRSLEDWLGVELVDRSSYPARLTSLAEDYVPRMEALMESIDSLRQDLREQYQRRDTFIISTQSSLSSAFCPAWLTQISATQLESRVRIVAGNLYDCLDDFLGGRSDLLLCYDFPDMNPLLERNDLLRKTLVEDKLIPVAALSWLEKAKAGEHVEHVAFPEGSFFGDLIQRETHSFFSTQDKQLHHRFETAHAEGAAAMVKLGLGMSWLPERLIEDDLASGLLSKLPEFPSIPLEIHCIRNRDSGSPFLSEFWNLLT
jgi:DNA-binding transcriptional LysR family regulator